MRKLLLLTILIVGSSVYAQEKSNEEYNKWSLEAGVGMPIIGTTFAEHYHYKNNTVGAYQFGVRHMMNNRFGLKMNFGYNTIDGTTYSAPFKSEFITGTLEGVANAGALLNFDSWTKTLNALIHIGAGYSLLRPQEPVKFGGLGDQIWLASVGITPQVKLSNRIVLTADYTLMGAMRMHNTWDGTSTTDHRGINGTFSTVTAGLTVYLGKHDVHADWVRHEGVTEDKFADLEARVAKIETDLLDSDGDGVADYLDQEPNTPAGMYVDTKGRSLDTNNNNIPDYMEEALDARYALKGEGGDGMIIKQLIDSGLINVYFPFDSTKPHAYSTHSMNYVIEFMNDNPNVNVELVGYADEIGNTNYNQRLSERRAKVVHDVLLASGISANRLSYRGAGEDASVDKNSEIARRMMRRVVFELK